MILDQSLYVGNKAYEREHKLAKEATEKENIDINIHPNKRTTKKISHEK